MRRTAQWLVAAAALSSLVCAGAVHATTFSVTKTEDSSDGACDADCSLREAIIAANASPGADEVVVPAGTHLLTLTGPPEDAAATGDLDITDSLTLTGASGAIIQGDPTEAVLAIPVAQGGVPDVAIVGLTIRGGTYGFSGEPRLLTITASSFVANGFAGLELFSVADTTDISITDSTISGNGDGIVVALSPTFTPSALSVMNSTLSGNTQRGVVIDCQSSSSPVRTDVELTNVTLAENPIGLALINTAGPRCGDFLVTNSLVDSLSSNCQGLSAGGVVDAGGNVENLLPASCFASQALALNLGPLQDNGGPTETHALPSDSPALDQGVDAGCPGFDQRGQARPTDGDLDGRGGCDPGAFELMLSPLTTTTVSKMDDTNDGVCDADCSLREAIIAANASPGLDDIILPGGVYPLSLAGADEDSAATGDLDVTDDLRLIGAGSATTLIDASGIDRVLHVIDARATISGLTLQNGAISGSRGGGALVQGSPPARLGVYRSVIADSQSIDGDGGGLAAEAEALLVVTQSTLSGNSTDGDGGGCYECADILNSTISGNSADRGGGISGLHDIQSVTIALNSAVTAGGGLFWSGTFSGGSPDNSLFSDNIGAACSPVILFPGESMDDDGTCGFTLSNLPAMLGPLLDNGGPTPTHALFTDSLAIDAGGASQCPASDQRGNLRTDGNADGAAVCDVGAFERAAGSGTCDVNGDGGTDLMDVTLMRRELAGLPVP